MQFSIGRRGVPPRTKYIRKFFGARCPSYQRYHQAPINPCSNLSNRLNPANVKKAPSKKLDRFPNPAKKPYTIRFECPEFTCLCPKTGQPDFATIRIQYCPSKFCVELKSLKLYLWSFRDEGHFHEAVTNKICDDLATLLKPKWIEVEGDFYVRGGIKTVVRVKRGCFFSLPTTNQQQSTANVIKH